MAVNQPTCTSPAHTKPNPNTNPNPNPNTNPDPNADPNLGEGETWQYIRPRVRHPPTVGVCEVLTLTPTLTIALT